MHPFIQSLAKADECAKCKRTAIQHTKDAVCESCCMTGPCEIEENDDILMCEHCTKRDKEIKIEVALYKVQQLKKELVPEKTFAAELLTVAKSIEIDNAMTTSQDFFNAETVAVVDLQKAIDADENIAADQKHFELVRVIRARYTHFRSVLFEVKKVELEITSRERALQYRLNELASKFRGEEREKLKLQDLTYIPKEVAVKAPKVKLTPEEKLIEQYAAIMKVPIEQARIMFNAKMKNTKPESTIGENK